MTPFNIYIFGEAIVDMIQQNDGNYRPVLGGAPFNFAISYAKLLNIKNNSSVKINYINPVSYDFFGQQIIDQFKEIGIQYNKRSKLPTALALVNFSKNKQPQYQFYRHRVADSDFNSRNFAQLVAMPNKANNLFHTGCLALSAQNVNWLATYLNKIKTSSLISLDLNLRSVVQSNLRNYLKAIERYAIIADIIKVSDQDMTELLQLPENNPNTDSKVNQKFNFWLDKGVKVIVYTKGSKGASVFSQNGYISEKSEVIPITKIKDTVGAGDVFYATFIASLLQQFGQNGLEKIALTTYQNSLKIAHQAAAYSIQQFGCIAPTFKDLLK